MARLSGQDLISLATQATTAEVLVVQDPVIVEVPVPVSTAVVVSASPVSVQAMPAPVKVHEARQEADDEEEEDVPYETVKEEIARLNATVAALNETNDRIMAQNIALLSDLEAAQKAVRELRSEKDALAVQLKARITTA